MNYSLIILKPDALQKGVVADVFDMIRESGLTITNVREPAVLDEDLLKQHYSEHEGKPFYDSLIKTMRSGPAITAIVAGDDARRRIRELAGETEPAKSGHNTIRGRFSDDTYAAAEAEGRSLHNVIHTSGNVEEAKKEMRIWFPELFDKEPTLSGSPSVPDKATSMRCDI